MVAQALELSERFEIPVMLRPTTRVCHARQNVPCGAAPAPWSVRPASRRTPAAGAPPPVFAGVCTGSSTTRSRRSPGSLTWRPLLTPGDGSYPRTCIIASGVACAHAWDCLEDLGASGPDRFLPGDHALSPEPGFQGKDPTRATTRSWSRGDLPGDRAAAGRRPGPGPELQDRCPGKGS